MRKPLKDLGHSLNTGQEADDRGILDFVVANFRSLVTSRLPEIAWEEQKEGVRDISCLMTSWGRWI